MLILSFHPRIKVTATETSTTFTLTLKADPTPKDVANVIELERLLNELTTARVSVQIGGVV